MPRFPTSSLVARFRIAPIFTFFLISTVNAQTPEVNAQASEIGIQASETGAQISQLENCLSAAGRLTISGITVTDLEHGSARIHFCISQDSYVQILFDTKSGGSGGVYQYSSMSVSTAQNLVHNFGAFSLGALKPGTTYYFVVAARPHATDSVDLVRSTEQYFTTPADPGHPVMPIAPAVYNPILNTSGYTAIRMTSGSPECRAAISVSAPDKSWTVTQGDSVQTVLDKVGYGAILDFDEGITCKVPDINPHNAGYLLRAKNLDPNATGIADPNHRWIVIQTHQSAPTDLPPPGFRTSSSWDGKMAQFVARVPTTLMYSSGEHFETEQPDSKPNATPGNVHHYWIRNLRLSVDPSADGVFGAYIDFGGSCVARTYPPSYNVVEQVHFVGAPLSGSPRSRVAIDGCPHYLALKGNSIEGFDTPGSWSQGVYFADWSLGSYNIDNNFIQGIGQNIYLETNVRGPSIPEDISLTHNYLSWPLYSLKGNPAWDGNARVIRNQFESKGMRRVLLSGNIIDGQWAFQNEGSAIFLSGVPAASLGQTGITDVSIKDNIIRHAANLLNCLATRGDDQLNPGFPDNSVMRRVLFSNNLVYNLGRHSYNYLGAGASLYSGYIITAPGCQDLVVQQNTFGFTDANDVQQANYYYVPAILGVGSGAQLSEGFYFQNNIAHFSIGYPHTHGGIVDDATQFNSSFPRKPAIDDAHSFAGILKTAMVQLDGSKSGMPNAVWGGNVMIGGTLANGAQPWPEMTAADVQSYSSGSGGRMPSGDTYVSGDTISARQASAGLDNVANGDYTCTPTSQNPANALGKCSAGADVDQTWNAAGVVRALTVTPNSLGAIVEYTAPDANACSLDYGTGNDSGIPVYSTRVLDSGGNVSRRLSLSGTANTTYNYRLLCYFEQGPDSKVPDGVPTAGTFTTLNGTSSRHWYATGAGGVWTTRRPISIVHTQVAGSQNLANFPVLISVTDSDLRSIANGGKVASPTGADILFTAADGITKLPHEIETYVPSTGQLTAWVEAPDVSPAADTNLYLYYGNSAASNQQNPAEVWQPNYSFVLHLSNGAKLSGYESTSNAVRTGFSLISPSPVPGKVGGGAQFSRSLLQCGYVSNIDGKLAGPQGTLELWINPVNWTHGHFYDLVSVNANPGFSSVSFDAFADTNTNQLSFNARLPSYSYSLQNRTPNPLNIPFAKLPVGSWSHIVYTWNGSSATAYLNGTPYVSASGQLESAAPTNSPFMFGGSEYNGFGDVKLDELRYSSVARSPAWIVTEYHNMNSPSSFIAVGGSQPYQ